MPSRIKKLVFSSSFMASALVLAVGFFVGSSSTVSLGFGAALALLNIAAYNWIYGKLIESTGKNPGFRVVAGMLAMLKFLLLCFIVLLLIGPAGLNPAMFALGFALGIVAPALGFIAITKGTGVCRTE